MIGKYFNEEVDASNKNWKVNGSAVCFLCNIFFLCNFYNRSLYCFKLVFSFGKKVGGSEKSLLLDGSEKKRLLKGVENGPADNVTCAVQNDHCLPEHKFRVFATGQ